MPGPWAFLRYVPIIGLARAPSRFTVLVVLGLSILFAFALTRLRPFVRVLIMIALAIELMPAPCALYSAEVPEVYKLITATTDEAGRVLELPTGMRDGIRRSADSTRRASIFRRGTIGR